jgi:hypothetical protein
VTEEMMAWARQCPSLAELENRRAAGMSPGSRDKDVVREYHSM